MYGYKMQDVQHARCVYNVCTVHVREDISDVDRVELVIELRRIALALGSTEVGFRT